MAGAAQPSRRRRHRASTGRATTLRRRWAALLPLAFALVGACATPGHQGHVDDDMVSSSGSEAGAAAADGAVDDAAPASHPDLVAPATVDLSPPATPDLSPIGPTADLSGADLVGAGDLLGADLSVDVEPDMAVPVAADDMSANAPADLTADQASQPDADQAMFTGCTFKSDCPNGLVCDPTSRSCVECDGDADCPAGKLCGAAHACLPGCSASHACAPDGGVCQVSAARCVACLSDVNCTTAAAPRCDTAAARCVPCLTTQDNCGANQYCALNGGTYSCTPGCKDDRDCIGDGGASGHCDAEVHLCVGCFLDGDCPAGLLCENDTCVPGCKSTHLCPSQQSCCNGGCVDLHADARNCGACGMVCAGGRCCASTCTTVNDPLNCGACGTVCNTPNALAGCFGGACTVGSCHAGYADCNGKVSDGCEVHTDVDVGNCGGCGNLCSEPHQQQLCTAGKCGCGACTAPWKNCDGDCSNGCETNVLDTDVNNCGGCGLTCTVANGVAACVNGVCKVASCYAGYVDCDLSATNGCEIHTAASLANCGSCGTACSVTHGTPVCTGGQCMVASCIAGYADCDGKSSNGCEQLTINDINNCGTCGHVCPGGSSAMCVNSVCKSTGCAAGQGDCDGNTANGCETNLATSINNCGSCDVVCSTNHLTPNCAAAVCNGGCKAGYSDCNANKQTDGCETDIFGSPNNCGACGLTCSSTGVVAPTCANGVCTSVCKSGYSDCNNNLLGDGCETNTDGDLRNCGGCNMTCSSSNIAAPQCAGGACTGSCSNGYADCNGDKRGDGCETSISDDVHNCGGCGMACSSKNMSSTACFDSVCGGLCNAGYADCNKNTRLDGCETATFNNIADCGACGRVCSTANITPSCQSGVCAGTCTAPYLDCNGDKLTDGCETDPRVDNLHCGGCGGACSSNHIPSPFCAGSVCQGNCANGYADCNNNKLSDGCEVTLATDPSNCGNCGTVCSTNHVPVPTCAAGLCSGACNSGFADCNNNKLSDGCETPVSADINNCGGCNVVCSSNNVVQACAAGACSGTCLANYADCNGNKQTDGCETPTASDPLNCGMCNFVCPANAPSCTNGSCRQDTVLIVGTSRAGFSTDVQAKLMGTGSFSKVDVFYADTATPTAAVLAGYDAVLVFSDHPNEFLSPSLLGNNLATYFTSSNGRVVIATDGNVTADQVSGTFGSVGSGFVLINPGIEFVTSAQFNSSSDILVPGHPVMANVSFLFATAARRNSGNAANNGVVIAQWHDGTPLAVAGVVQGRKRVDLNLFPVSSSAQSNLWMGDGAILLRNALIYR